VDDDRRQALLAAKLRALVRAAGAEPLTDAPAGDGTRVPGGAAGVVAADGSAWYLAGDPPARSLGPALVWLDRARPGAAHHLVVDDADVLSLRVAAITDPPALYQVEGPTVAPVTVPSLWDALETAGPPVVFDPESYLASLPGPARAAVARLLDTLHTVDAVTVEREVDGVVLTVRGLEVARVEVDGDDAYLDVGVGKFDRAAHREIKGTPPLGTDIGPALDHLRTAVAAVLEKRRVDAPEHQIRSLRAERWLRAQVVADPSLAGLPAGVTLVPAAPPVAVPDLTARAAAPAIGDGEVVVCSTGIDLDLVPSAAHSWLQATTSLDAPPPRLTIVVPARDDHPIHRRLVARLRPELAARIVTVPDTWQTE
jgi:hypothetical protein